MKLIQIVLFAALLAMTAQASAQSCYLSSDCAAGELCVNKECAAPVLALSACSVNTDCDFPELCQSGFCVPDGVYCSSETGSGIVGIHSGEINCMNGNGEGWATGMDCGADEDGEPCTLPSNTDLTDAELENLYTQCINTISASCGEETPVPEEVCSPEALQSCTDWMIFGEEVQQNCAFEWHDISAGDPSEGGSSSDTRTDLVPDMDGDVDGGIETPVDEDAGSGGGDDDGDIPQISGLFSVKGLAGAANPWLVVDCCADLDDVDEDDEELQMFQSLISTCATNLSTSDCDGIAACWEDVLDEFGYEVVEVEVVEENSEANTSTGGDNGDQDELTDDDRKADGADGNGTAAIETDGSSDDSGCSTATPGNRNTSLFSLIF